MLYIINLYSMNDQEKGHSDYGDVSKTLEIKITRLKQAIETTKQIVAELKTEREQAQPEHQAELDSEIKRYEQTIILNEKELEQLGTDLLSGPSGTNSVN
jgi:chromosome segregation ATPase